MRLWMPLVVGALMVPASLTAFGFTLYGEELEAVLSPSPAEPAVVSDPVPLGPVLDLVEPLRLEPAAPPVLSTAVAGLPRRYPAGQGVHGEIPPRVVADPRSGPAGGLRTSDRRPDQLDVLIS